MSRSQSPPSSYSSLDQFITEAASFLNNDMTVYGHVTIQGSQGTKRTLHGELYMMLENHENVLYMYSEWGSDYPIRTEILNDGAAITSAYMSSDPDGRIKIGTPFGNEPIPPASPQRAARRSQQSMMTAASQSQISLAGKKRIPEHLFPMNEYIDDDDNIASLPPNMSDSNSIAKNLNARCAIALHIPAATLHLYKDAILRPDWVGENIITTYERILASSRSTTAIPLVAEELIRGAIESIRDIAAMKTLSKNSPSAVFYLAQLYARQILTLICQISCLSTADKKSRLAEILSRLETEDLKVAKSRYPTLADLSFIQKYFRERWDNNKSKK